MTPYQVALQHPWNLFSYSQQLQGQCSLKAADTFWSSVEEEKLPLLQTQPHHPPQLTPLCFMPSAAKLLMKDNLFRCLMLWHWLVEDYVWWLGDLWRLAEACVSAWEAKCGCYGVCACHSFSVFQWVSVRCVWEGWLNLCLYSFRSLLPHRAQLSSSLLMLWTPTFMTTAPQFLEEDSYFLFAYPFLTS